MKKITFISAATFLGAMLFAAPAFAATTATLTPGSTTVAEGAKFSVTIAVNPSGTANYAEKIELDYPADTLEVVSFSQGSNWMALTQSGYDTTDNDKGVLIKTAGYASGFTDAKNFGIVTFRAKKAGSATITLGASSVAFESSAQTPVSGNNTFVTIASTTPATVEGAAPTTGTSANASIDKTATNTGSDLTTALGQQGAAAEGSGVSFSGKTILWILLGIVLASGIWAGYKNAKKKEEGTTTPPKKN